MGIQFEIFSKKNKFPTDGPIPVKQGRVRGNKNIFKVGLNPNKIPCLIYTFVFCRRIMDSVIISLYVV